MLISVSGFKESNNIDHSTYMCVCVYIHIYIYTVSTTPKIKMFS